MDSTDAAKIRWRCRRGMLELDQLLHAFFDKEFSQLSEDEQTLFSKFLDHTDQELYRWLIGLENSSDSQFNTLIHKIQQAK